MKIFITAMIVMAQLSAVIYIWMKNVGNKRLDDPKVKMTLRLVLTVMVVLLLDLIAGGDVLSRLPADFSLPASCLYLMSSSLFDYKDIRRTVKVLMSLELLLGLYYLFCASGIPAMLPSGFFNLPAAVGALSFPLIFIVGTLRRFRTVKEVLKSGNVWAYVCLGTDAVYALSYPFLMILYLLAYESGMVCGRWIAVVPLICIGMMVIALALRICDDSLFLLCTAQERRIVESMKVSNVASASDSSHIEEVYRDVYERVAAYFDSEKPYLDSELTIADLVKVLYSNKLYISRAISQFTGRNFRQFVNYHRVQYSMECFRENPDLKVHEMGAMSGFNSIVSYNMAFRLFMGENPSDWCRKEKSRMVKGKK